MHILLGREGSCVQSIELSKVCHHKALPHLSKLISSSEKHYQNRINRIHIENSIFNHDDYNALQTIFHQCNELHEIKLDSNHIDDRHTHELFAALTKNKLTSISYTDNLIGEKISDDYFEFIRFQQDLQAIDFSLNWLRDKGIIKFVNSLSHDIKQLFLSCNDFHVEGMRAISQYILKCDKLSELDISYNSLNEESAEWIAHIISGSNSIKKLKVNSNQIGDKGVRVLAEAVKHNTNMVHLDLSDNGISLSGAKYLVECAAGSKVPRQLNLKNNCISVEEARHLSTQYPLIEALF